MGQLPQCLLTILTRHGRTPAPCETPKTRRPSLSRGPGLEPRPTDPCATKNRKGNPSGPGSDFGEGEYWTTYPEFQSPFPHVHSNRSTSLCRKHVIPGSLLAFPLAKRFQQIRSTIRFSRTKLMNVKPYDFQMPRILHVGTEATLQQFCHILKVCWKLARWVGFTYNLSLGIAYL